MYTDSQPVDRRGDETLFEHTINQCFAKICITYIVYVDNVLYTF